MRAAFYDEQGPASQVIEVGELPDPRAGQGEVRVKLAVSGLNPSDLKGRSGFSGPMKYPRIVPGQDGAGVIDEVGPGVSETRIGERVWIYEAQVGRAMGTSAELVVVPSSNAVLLPDGVGFDTGACLGVPAMTAHKCLLSDGPIAGQTVLVQGGGGAVGHAAILLAKWAGARVIATVSRLEQDRSAREAGADVVINRRTEDVVARIELATNGSGVQRIVDVDMAANIEIDMACIAANGVLSGYAVEDPQATVSIPFRWAMLRGLAFRFVYVYGMTEQDHRRAVNAISECLASGTYRPRIGHRLPLERLAEAHAYQESGTVVGKILLDIG